MRFAEIIRNGEVLRQAAEEERLRRETAAAEATVAQALAPFYARGWDQALTPFRPAAGAEPEMLNELYARRRRRQTLREKMPRGHRREDPEGDNDSWDAALEEFAPPPKPESSGIDRPPVSLRRILRESRSTPTEGWDGALASFAPAPGDPGACATSVARPAPESRMTIAPPENVAGAPRSALARMWDRALAPFRPASKPARQSLFPR
jgi:hypothetical protein